MWLKKEHIEYFEEQTGRLLIQTIQQWLDVQHDILREDTLALGKMEEDPTQLSEYRETKSRMEAILVVLDLDDEYDITKLPFEYGYVMQELEDYRFFLEHDAIPNADLELMRQISISDVALINAVLSIWPSA